MTTNLVTSVMQFLTPELIAKIARPLGLDAGLAQKVVSAGVPAILASFAGVAANPGGAQQLSDTLSRQNPSMLSQMTSALGGPGQKAIADTGSGLLSSLLGGSGMNALISAVSSFAGVNQGAGKSLLGLLAPAVAGVLGQQQRSGGLDASGIANLLSSQKDQIAAAMPPGLGSLLKSGGVLDAVDDSLRRDATAATAAAGRMAGTASDMAAGASRAAYATARNPLAASWPYWLAGLLVLAGVGWYFLGDHGTRLAEQGQQLANPTSVSAANLSADLTSSIDTVRSTLQGITDPTSARAALPKLQEATAQLDRIKGLAEQLPPDSRKHLASLLGASMPALNQLCDQTLSRPQVVALAKPTIDALRAKLELLAQTT